VTSDSKTLEDGGGGRAQRDDPFALAGALAAALNCTFGWSGWPDSNRRPLDPQSILGPFGACWRLPESAGDQQFYDYVMPANAALCWIFVTIS
jgi:hypothetical protein